MNDILTNLSGQCINTTISICSLYCVQQINMSLYKTHTAHNDWSALILNQVQLIAIFLF